MPHHQPTDADSGTSRGRARVGWLLAGTGELAATGFRAALPPGVHPRQFAVLSLLAANGGHGASQRAVADQLAIPPGRLVPLLDDLEGQALVRRNPSPDDRRTHLLQLTPAGRERAAELARCADEYERQLSRALSDQECAQLASLLERLDLPGSGATRVW